MKIFKQEPLKVKASCGQEISLLVAIITYTDATIGRKETQPYINLCIEEDNEDISLFFSLSQLDDLINRLNEIKDDALNYMPDN